MSSRVSPKGAGEFLSMISWAPKGFGDFVSSNKSPEVLERRLVSGDFVSSNNARASKGRRANASPAAIKLAVSGSGSRELSWSQKKRYLFSGSVPRSVCGGGDTGSRDRPPNLAPAKPPLACPLAPTGGDALSTRVLHSNCVKKTARSIDSPARVVGLPLQNAKVLSLNFYSWCEGELITKWGLYHRKKIKACLFFVVQPTYMLLGPGHTMCKSSYEYCVSADGNRFLQAPMVASTLALAKKEDDL